MRRVARSLLVMSAAWALVGAPAPALGADPPKDGHPVRTDAERTGPLHVISGDIATVAAPSGTVDVVSATWWIDTNNDLNVAGEVRNGMSTRRHSVEVVVTVRNAAAAVVGTMTIGAYLDQLAPGTTTPFWNLMDAPPGATTVDLEAKPGTPVTAVPKGALSVTLGVPYTDSNGWRHHPGTVHNLAGFGVQYVVANMAVYNASGDVIDASWAYPSPHEIPAKGSAPFDIVLTDWNPKAVRVAFAADGHGAVDFSNYVTSWNNYFNDIGASSFRSDIVWNAEQGITTGCGAGLFCPTATVPRDQMASFLARALDLSGTAPNAFSDDAGNPHEPNINLVAREGIASGCGGGKFCPAAKVARDQMASFLARARSLGGAAPDAFTDDDGNLHETNINLVAREGIATGCGGGKYCPSALVTREQMAAFLRRAFDGT